MYETTKATAPNINTFIYYSPIVPISLVTHKNHHLFTTAYAPINSDT